MDNNLKLRKAIIVAIALIGTGYSLHSKAMGLGDIQVKSSLGQPLLANIPVHGIDHKMDERCFAVSSDDTNAISDVKFKLRHLSGDEGVLTVTSNHAVLEPIAQLTVVSQCDSIFTRQYSLLIDPSISNAPQPTEANLDSESPTEQRFTSNNAETNVAAPAAAQKQKSKRKQTRAKTNTASQITTNQVTSNQSTAIEASIAAPTSAFAPKAAVKEAASTTPKLTISGGDLTANAANPYTMRLNFDKKINTSRDVNPQAYAEEAEFADEVTVMNNRLSHLEKQLTGLYSKNARLETLNKEGVAALSEIKHENDFLRTLSFCLGGGLLVSGYFFVDWLRRRKAEKSEGKVQAIWDGLETTQESEVSAQAFKIDENYVPIVAMESFEVKTEDDMSEFEQTSIFNSPFLNKAPEGVMHENTDVIEDADVFISHGRTNLAVQLLQSHLMESPKKSASTWLFYLDLLAKEGMKEAFDEAAAECRKHFNVQLAEFSTPLINDADTLESFERITSELQKVWGTPEALRFLDELINNTRMEPRMGFDKAVFEELVLLREIAQEEIILETKPAHLMSAPLEFDMTSTQNAFKKDNVVKLNLPEIEIPESFKSSNGELSLLTNADSAAEIHDEEHFEFELLDVVQR